MLFVSIEDILCKGQIIIETHLVSIFFFNLRSLAIEKTKLPNFFTPLGNFCTAFHVKKREEKGECDVMKYLVRFKKQISH